MRRLLFAFLLFLAAPAFAMAETITGTVTYLQRIALPPGAVVEIQFQDVSRADALARTFATYRLDDPGAPPYHFAFAYDPATIDERNSYALRATVRLDGKLLMTTDTAYPVLTRGAGKEVDMVMKMVERRPAPKPDSDFVNTYWKLLTLGGAEVPVSDGGREPHVILRMDGSYNATVGCNMIRGQYDVSDSAVTFGPGATTQMACLPPFDALERNLVEMLGNASAYAVSGESMELLDTSSNVLATFRAVYF